MLRCIVLKITAGARFILNDMFFNVNPQVGFPIELDKPNMHYALETNIDCDKTPCVVMGFDGTWLDGNGNTIRYTG